MSAQANSVTFLPNHICFLVRREKDDAVHGTPVCVGSRLLYMTSYDQPQRQSPRRVGRQCKY